MQLDFRVILWNGMMRSNVWELASKIICSNRTRNFALGTQRKRIHQFFAQSFSNNFELFTGIVRISMRIVIFYDRVRT